MGENLGERCLPYYKLIMNKSTLILACVVMIFASSGRAYSASTPCSTGQVAFAKAFVAAMQSKNATAMMSLLHPTDRACVNDKTRAFYQTILKQQLGSFPNQKTKEITVTPVGAKSEPSLWQFLPPKMFPYPVMPTHKIQINFGFGADGYLGIDMIEVAPKGANWYWVTACPTAEGMKLMRDMQKRSGH